MAYKIEDALGTAKAKEPGMKVYLSAHPVSKRVHGWKRAARYLASWLSSSLVVELGTRRA